MLRIHGTQPSGRERTHCFEMRDFRIDQAMGMPFGLVALCDETFASVWFCKIPDHTRWSSTNRYRKEGLAFRRVVLSVSGWRDAAPGKMTSYECARGRKSGTVLA